MAGRPHRPEYPGKEAVERVAGIVVPKGSLWDRTVIDEKLFATFIRPLSGRTDLDMFPFASGLYAIAKIGSGCPKDSPKEFHEPAEHCRDIGLQVSDTSEVSDTCCPTYCKDPRREWQ